MQFTDDQAASRIIIDGKVSEKCDRCRQMYAERKLPGMPPCESCRVELQVENEDAARIFQIVRGQVITRFNGQADIIIDLNHLAVWAAIDAYGVQDKTKCFEKVLNLFHAVLKDRRENES